MKEDVWFEAARLLPPEPARKLLVKALSRMSTSKKLWMQMANMEKEKDMRVKTLRKALTCISNDVDLWKAAVELEEPEEAKKLLYKAIECVPHDTGIWIALAKLEDYRNARKVLNQAAKKIPTDHTLWVHAAKLEEAEGKYEIVPKLIQKGIKNLKGAAKHNSVGRESVKITRDQWLKEAYEAELSQSIVTARAIIKETLYEGIEDKQDQEENKKIWFEIAENLLSRGAIECSRSLLLCVCKELRDDDEAWMKAITLEKQHGNNKTLGNILKLALQGCDQQELFFLMYAKHLWKKENNIDEAINILKKGLDKLEDEEELYLALVKLYKEKRMFTEARRLLMKGRKN